MGEAVLVLPASSTDAVAQIDAAYLTACRAHGAILALIPVVDESGEWEADGARDIAHWLSMRFGVSSWKAHRWVAAARKLPELPAVGSALASGQLSLDKVVELTRFAAPSDEAKLVAWARRVAPAAVRKRADLAVARAEQEQEVADARFLHIWREADRVALSAELPSAQGEVVARAIERLATSLPEHPNEVGEAYMEQRRADALYALCSASLAADPDPDRATVIVHVPLESLHSGQGNAEVGAHGIVPAATAERLACGGRVQTIVEDALGNVAYVSPMGRRPAPWMERQVRHRDGGCVFPGCGTRAFTQAHHIRFWSHGGKTELSNLALICSFHHRLVHEEHWSLSRRPDATYEWRRPNGRPYDPEPPLRVGPAP